MRFAVRGARVAEAGSVRPPGQGGGVCAPGARLDERVGVRVGKHIQLEVEAADEAAARSQVEEMSRAGCSRTR